VYNRYRDILPYDDNVMELKSDEFKGAGKTNYINASPIAFENCAQKFIACQAPKKSADGFPHFWHLIVQEKVSLVVMITQLREGEPPNQRTKAEQYWPDSQDDSEMAQTVTFLGGLKVDHVSTSTNASYVLRKFLLHLPDGGNREVTQMQCEIWPDLDAPDDPKVLVDMVVKAQELQAGHMGPENPILVHCSAGVGRTGTFIALYKLWQDYQNPNVTSLTILPTVVELRKQRTMMVQRPKQYVYVAKCLSFLISTEEGDYYEGENEDVDYENDEAENLGKDEVKPNQISDDQSKVGVETVQNCEEPQNKTGQDEKELIKDVGDSFKNKEKKKEIGEANSQGQKENKDQETK